MGKSLLAASSFGNVSASTTLYLIVGISSGRSASMHATEAYSQVPYRTAGKIKNLYIRMVTNDRATSTYKLRVNGATVNNSVSISGSTTGEFQDSSNSDSIAIGGLVCGQLITGAGGTTFTSVMTNALFIPDIGSLTLSKFVYNNSGEASKISAGTTTYYFGIVNGQSNTTNTGIEFPVKTNGKLRNFSTYIISNTGATSTTVGNRKNNAAGSLSISIGGTLTGLFQDNTSVESLLSGDTIGYFMTAPVGTLVNSFISSELITPNGDMQMIEVGTATNNQNTTFYFSITDASKSTTESDIQTKAQAPFLVKNLFYANNTNTVTATSTFTFRVNAADTALTLSIPASTTGTFSDDTHSVAIVPTSQVNYKIVSGAGGTSSQLARYGTVFRNVPGGVGFFGGGMA